MSKDNENKNYNKNLDLEFDLNQENPYQNKNSINIKQNNYEDIFEELIKENITKNNINNPFENNSKEPLKNPTQYNTMKKLKEDLRMQPDFDFGIPLNENASLSIIQKFMDKKDTTENFEKILSKINILKWLKVYSVIMNKDITSVNFCLNQLKQLYSFDYSKSKILCEVKNLNVIDCYQLLDVIDANLTMKKIILTKKIKKDSKDKGKIRLFCEYFVNIGDFIMFIKPNANSTMSYNEEYLQLDIKDIHKIIPFNL